MNLWAWFVSFARAVCDDARFALRALRRRPRFFVALALIASMGVGATTAMASLVQATLLRPLPFPDSERLVALWSTLPNDDRVGVSLPDLDDWRRQAHSFERLAVAHDWAFGLSVPGSPAGMFIGALVSGDYFPLLGVKPLHGRLLGPEDDGAGQPCRAVISEALFRTRFGSQASVVGQTVELDGNPCALVGVAEPGFDFFGPQYPPVWLWVNIGAIWPGYAERVRRDEQEFRVLGKLRPGVSVASSSAELAAIAQRISREHPGHPVGARVTSLHDDGVAPLRPRVLGLFLAISAVFLAACSNIAGLFLVRTQARRGELALRSAFGATRSRLARQLVTEVAVIFVVALPAAWLLAHWFVAMFTSITAGGLRGVVVAVDNRVLFTCMLLSSVTGLLFGLGPALAVSDVSPGSGLVEAGTGAPGSPHQRRLRAALVIAQIAAACALAATSNTAFRAVAELVRTPGGFDAEGLVTIRFSPQRRRYPDPALLELLARLSDGLRSQPGVRAVAVCTGLPLQSQWFDGNFQRLRSEPGATPAPSRFIATLVTPGFFDVLQMPLLAGREFAPTDVRDDAKRVVIINETLRSRFFANENPIGQLLQHDFGGSTAPSEIIGVVGDVRRFGLQVPPMNEIYMPIGQYVIRSLELILRVEPQQVQDVARQLPGWVAEIDPALPLWYTSVQNGAFQRTLQPELRLSALLGSFALACLGLAALGLYAAVSYAASQRTREYGIRAALGASPWNIVWLVTSAALRWVTAGVALALCALLAFGGVLSRQIAGAPAFETRSFLLAAAVVAIVALCACIGPALSAIRLSPANALRRE